MITYSRIATALALTALLVSCKFSPTDPQDLVGQGELLFFNETFNGNGRTCGTCHRREDNFGLSPSFIAGLPKDDPLFVAETQPNLVADFEKPLLMRRLGLILENQDGFDDLQQNFNMRGIPHTLALNTSIRSAAGPRTGWSGDGSPGDGTLRSFATGAVIQHFTKSVDRIVGIDFRLPTNKELDALEAFQLSLGRQEDIALPLPLISPVAARGQELFMDRTAGKCNACHFNAGANGDPGIFGPNAGNLSFNTGVEALLEQPADLIDPNNPVDDGFGTPGNGEFNTPPLVEAADTAPFFHNNSAATLETAVAFYNGDAFNNSPAGQLLLGATGSGINLDATATEAVASFLRVINALENIRAALQHLTTADLQRAAFEVTDAIEVLAMVNLHLDAVADLRLAQQQLLNYPYGRRSTEKVRLLLQSARAAMVRG